MSTLIILSRLLLLAILPAAPCMDRMDVPESYAFDLSMTQRMEVNGQHSEIIWHFNKEGKHLGMEQSTMNGMKVFMVMDFDQQLNVILTEYPDGSKKGSVYSGLDEINEVTTSHEEEEDWYDDEGAEEETPEEEETVSIVRTGKTKTIAGYTCREYQVNVGSEQSTVWAAADFPVKWNEHYGSYFMDFSGQEKEGVRMIEGMPMESFGSSVEDGETYQIHMIVTEVNTKRWILRTGDYRFSE